MLRCFHEGACSSRLGGSGSAHRRSSTAGVGWVVVQVGQHRVRHDEHDVDRLVQLGRITMMVSCRRSVVQVVQVVQNETVRSRRRPV
jgi:hypothetical protein